MVWESWEDRPALREKLVAPRNFEEPVEGGQELVEFRWVGEVGQRDGRPLPQSGVGSRHGECRDLGEPVKERVAGGKFRAAPR